MSKCRDCNGKGWRHTVVGILFYSGIRALPTFRKCKGCRGFGDVYGRDEIDQEEREELFKLHLLNKSATNRI